MEISVKNFNFIKKAKEDSENELLKLKKINNDLVHDRDKVTQYINEISIEIARINTILSEGLNRESDILHELSKNQNTQYLVSGEINIMDNHLKNIRKNLKTCHFCSCMHDIKGSKFCSEKCKISQTEKDKSFSPKINVSYCSIDDLLQEFGDLE